MASPPFTNLTAYATRLAELVPDNRPAYTRTDLVEEALRLYAQDYPCVEAQDLGDGTVRAWALNASPFTRFDRGFSEQWPIDVEELDGAGAPQYPRVELDQGVDYYVETRGASGVLYLVFRDIPPTTSRRVRFRRRWRVDNAATPTNEVPLHHQEAVVKRAGAYACELLAAHYLKTVDATLGSDAFSAMEVVGRYQEKARALTRAYREALGLGEETTVSTGRARTRIRRVFPAGYEGDGVEAE